MRPFVADWPKRIQRNAPYNSQIGQLTTAKRHPGHLYPFHILWVCTSHIIIGFRKRCYTWTKMKRKNSPAQHGPYQVSLFTCNWWLAIITMQFVRKRWMPSLHPAECNTSPLVIHASSLLAHSHLLLSLKCWGRHIKHFMLLIERKLRGGDLQNSAIKNENV